MVRSTRMTACWYDSFSQAFATAGNSNGSAP